MDDFIFNSVNITSTAATVTALLGAEKPEHAAEPINLVLCKAQKAFGKAKADRVFMYNPDAVALWLYQKYTELFSGAALNSELALPIHSVMPSVTPVCFASMYTGAMPAVHGIRTYTKPVLSIETVFDSLIKTGKKPVIVSTEGDSISKIFLEREMDYFIYDSVEECNAKALELIESDGYDLIVLYNGDYDSTMHKLAPEGEESLKVLKNNCDTYAEIHGKISDCWKKHDSVLFFAPDHGCHEIDGKSGSHGLEMPEDMNIIHFYSFIPHGE